MGIDKELIDKLLADYKGPEDLIGEQGLLKELALVQIVPARRVQWSFYGIRQRQRRVAPACAQG